MSSEVIVADIGGTHARFAIAQIRDAQVLRLDHQVTTKSADYASLQTAWELYAKKIDRELPNQAAIAIAAPIGADIINLTNSSWAINPTVIQEQLKLQKLTLVNDFGAVGHTVMSLSDDMFNHICGPTKPPQRDGVTTIVGPGTGLGVAHVLRKNGTYFITETEGGHIDFAPKDAIEDKLLEHLRKSHQRVSVERIASGSGLSVIYEVLASIENKPFKSVDNKSMWQLALSGEDSLASAALERFCLCLGNITGDLALAQGADNVVISGGLGNRIAPILESSGFCDRFTAKGRFRSLMQQISVTQLLYPEPGLYGAGMAFILEHETNHDMPYRNENIKVAAGS